MDDLLVALPHHGTLCPLSVQSSTDYRTRYLEDILHVDFKYCGRRGLPGNF